MQEEKQEPGAIRGWGKGGRYVSFIWLYGIWGAWGPWGIVSGRSLGVGPDLAGNAWFQENITYGQEKQTQMLDLEDQDFKEP